MRRGGTWAILAAATMTIGCDSRSSGGGGNGGNEGGMAGRKATVEYRPVSKGGTETIQKQRIGTLTKVSSDWVGINDEADKIEVWVPRDMVLEIRLNK